MKLTNTHKSLLAGAGGAAIVFTILAGGAMATHRLAPHHRPVGFEQAAGPMGDHGMGMRGMRPTGGTVQSINDKTIVVKDDDNNTTTIMVDDNTKYSKDRNDASLADIKTGDKIAVFGKLSDNKVAAKRIIINPDFL